MKGFDIREKSEKQYDCYDTTLKKIQNNYNLSVVFKLI